MRRATINSIHTCAGRVHNMSSTHRWLYCYIISSPLLRASQWFVPVDLLSALKPLSPGLLMLLRLATPASRSQSWPIPRRSVDILLWEVRNSWSFVCSLFVRESLARLLSHLVFFHLVCFWPIWCDFPVFKSVFLGKLVESI